MRKFIVSAILNLFFNSFSFAVGLSDINQIVNLDGFAINESGKAVTNWTPARNNRVGSENGIEYYENRDGVGVVLKYENNSKIPRYISVISKDQLKNTHLFFGSAGEIKKLVKCEGARCAHVDEAYCRRLYSDFNVVSKKGLEEKMVVQTNFSIAKPNAAEQSRLKSFDFGFIAVHHQLYDASIGSLPPFKVMPDVVFETVKSFGDWVYKGESFSPAIARATAEGCDALILKQSSRTEHPAKKADLESKR